MGERALFAQVFTMTILPTTLPGVLLVEPRVFGDARGFFFESFNQRTWEDATGLRTRFVQDNHSRSSRGVLRGLHYQVRQTQGKLVRVTAGEVFDVAVDLRRSSPSFGKWEGFRLSAENKRQLWIPEGFAHGFLVLSEAAEVLYKATDYYAPRWERTVRWDDPDLAVGWPLEGEPILSPKDSAAPRLAAAEVFP
ncbi:MAG: dTDP-4-dehydrorhamnose 3,5-epimerase [Deferrisomatales bacterium]|nr:dTDP-4-dehydrorhamnose 3,5-epimerase [Deferrisomatales bacterium]